MTIVEQSKILESALAAWAEGNSGHASVASDVVHLVELLRMRPGAPKLAILFAEETPREPEELGRVDRVFRVVAARGRGFRLDTGESLTDGAGGGKPMFDIMEEAREIVRGLVIRDDVLEEEEWSPVYKGCRAFEVQGIVMDAYEMTFGLAAQLPGFKEVE